MDPNHQSLNSNDLPPRWRCWKVSKKLTGLVKLVLERTWHLPAPDMPGMWKGAVKGRNEACSFLDSFWDCCLNHPPAEGGPGLELNLLCLGLGTKLGQHFLLQQSREVISVYFEGWRVGAGPRG